jgi:Uma2 family endonuclease
MRRSDQTPGDVKTMPLAGVVEDDLLYPDSDGAPMADNTEQFDWIVAIKLNLEAIFAARDDVFVAGDLLWYPVEGDPKTRVAPDVLVAMGRPKGRRGSYLQWKEEAVAPQVVFEVLSPGNTPSEMLRKLAFYERHGVEEYYLVDPSEQEVTGWRREGAHLVLVDEMNGYVSPRLGIRFHLDAGRIGLVTPNGEPFEEFVDLKQQRDEQRQRAEHSERRADEQARGREQERQRAERLALKLRELGLDPDQL